MENDVEKLKGVVCVAVPLNGLVLVLLLSAALGVVSGPPCACGDGATKPCCCQQAVAAACPATGTAGNKRCCGMASPTSVVVVTQASGQDADGIDSQTLIELRDQLREITDGLSVPVQAGLQRAHDADSQLLGEVTSQLGILSQRLARSETDRTAHSGANR